MQTPAQTWTPEMFIAAASLTLLFLYGVSRFTALVQYLLRRWGFMAPEITSSDMVDAIVQTPVQPAVAPVQHPKQEPFEPGSVAFKSEEPPRTEGAAFVLSQEELAAVQSMLRYYLTTIARGDKPSKSGTILAGFGVKRGGTERYARASTIYDALLGEPEPAIKYREVEVAPGPRTMHRPENGW